MADIERELGGIDVLVASAIAWDFGQRPFDETDQEAWVRSLRTNVEGTARTVRAALQSMRRRQWGRIVIVSSAIAEEGYEGASAYGTAKAALYGLARTVAWEAGRHGVLCNVVVPGITETEMVVGGFPADVRSRFAARTPSRRLSQPQDVASLIVFLGSGANGNTSGAIVHEGSANGR
ncbi:MAG TPA: SDR family oxidoreductase, partial [Albitalea sp.]|nr:SDR family oxidoreductase [Albitalea sp.]